LLNGYQIMAIEAQLEISLDELVQMSPEDRLELFMMTGFATTGCSTDTPIRFGTMEFPLSGHRVGIESFNGNVRFTESSGVTP
jgi:hypothetical protein